jgi:hypothetical protein
MSHSLNNRLVCLEKAASSTPEPLTIEVSYLDAGKVVALPQTQHYVDGPARQKITVLWPTLWEPEC